MSSSEATVHLCHTSQEILLSGLPRWLAEIPRQQAFNPEAIWLNNSSALATHFALEQNGGQPSPDVPVPCPSHCREEFKKPGMEVI